MAKVLRDLARLPPKARRIDVEVAIWRSVTRHASTLTTEQIVEVTWQLLRELAGGARKVA